MQQQLRKALDAMTEAAEAVKALLATAREAAGGDEDAPASDPTPEGEFIACTPKFLPKRLTVPAAGTAIKENPVNAPMLHGPARAALRGVTLTPQHIALLTSKYWGAAQRQLTVSFMDQTPADLRDRILSHMNAWSARCGISFVWTQRGGDVRISFGPGGYYSYLGPDIRHIPANRQTMNLQGFTMRTPESEYRRVVRHETGHCLTGDTLIDCPRDLEKYPRGIPIQDLVGQTPWVYAWEGGRMVIRRASRVWLSKRQAEVVRVRLRGGMGPSDQAFLPPLELVGTPDHLVLLADGETWKPLGALKPGDRLCSLYRSKNGKRSRVRWTGSPDRVREHAFVCEQVQGARPDGHDAHHKNGRMLDQSPDNLEWKDEHLHHREHSLGRKDGPETSARRSAAQRDREPPTAEARAKMAAAARARSPMSEETRAKIGAVSRGKKQSAETVAKRTAAMKEFYAGGGRSGMYGKKASAETRAKRSASMKATLARKKAGGNHVVVCVERVTEPQDVFDMTVPGADSFVANGVVVHNSLGFPHEHMRRQEVARLDPAKTIAYFARTQGWDAQTVREQVLTPLEDADITKPGLEPTAPDETSIMCYQLPGSITRDGKPIPGGLDINESDYAFAERIYPKQGGTDDGGGDVDWLLAPQG